MTKRKTPGRQETVDLISAIREAAAADASCTLTHPQVNTLQLLLISLLDSARKADDKDERISALENALRDARSCIMVMDPAWRADALSSINEVLR